MWPYIIGGIFIILIGNICAYFYFRSQWEKVEKRIITIFLSKTAKIPALIEVMRDFVADEKVFDSLTKLHSDAMIRRFESIYALLEHNARIHNDFLFLMKLSVQIPELQTNEAFIYIREFIITHEREIKNQFSAYNSAVSSYNKFLSVKNLTIIGLILPFKKREYI